MQFTLEDESPRSWLGHAQSVETPAMSSVMWTCQNDLGCYDSMLKGLSKELTLVLNDTRELDRVPKTK